MKSLNADISAGEFRPLYLLYGEENYLKNQYRDRLRAAIVPEEDSMNVSRYEGKGIEIRQLIDQAETMPFFAEHRLIVVEDSGFFKNACPELVAWLPNLPQETILLFVESEVDRRSALFRQVKQTGRAVEMKRQDAKTLSAWILGILRREKRMITRDAMERFLEMSGDDMENIRSELEKLICYTVGKESIERSDVEEICTVTTENRIFDMVGAVAERRQKRALELYYDLLALKEAPMRILYLIAKQFYQMLQIRDLREQGLDRGAIAQRIGKAPFIVRKLLDQEGRFPGQTLRRAVEDCVELEEAVKTGRLSDRLAVELLIVKYSEPDGRA